MNTLDDLILALAGCPALPGAKCRGKSHLFNGEDGLEGERTRQAAQLCRRCPALDRCRAWADKQSPKALDGVVGARLYAYVSHESQRKWPNGIEVPVEPQ